MDSNVPKNEEYVIVVADLETFEQYKRARIREERRAKKSKEVYKAKREKQLDYKDTVHPSSRPPKQHTLIDITHMVDPEMLSQIIQLVEQAK